jgi:phospholipid/cholesterol/gamma-HCH transport system ATP-binding protein
MENDALIELRDVTKRFNGRTILDRVNLKIYQGQVTTIIGKSGMGKSVLLKHIIALIKPDEGSILFTGKPMDKMSRREWGEWAGKISYMFQNNALFDSLTVFENIALPLSQTRNLSKGDINRRVMARIEQTELTEVTQHYPSELSGGMQKRVALARALVTDPEIVLFDEPTTGQDLVRRNAILSMIAGYQRKLGFTAVLISHDIPDVFFISNRVIALADGRIVFQGSPEELEKFDHPFVDEFIQSLEGLQEQLTGLHSRRHFKVRYQTALARKHPQERFATAVFSINDLDLVSQNLGHEMTQKIIKALGAYINKHFGAVGGFSTRQGRGRFVTVLPFSDLVEAEQILEEFVHDLRTHGLATIGEKAQIPAGSCFEFSVSAGLAEGSADDEIESIVASANSTQKAVAQFQCEIGGKEK